MSQNISATAQIIILLTGIKIITLTELSLKVIYDYDKFGFSIFSDLVETILSSRVFAVLLSNSYARLHRCFRSSILRDKFHFNIYCIARVPFLYNTDVLDSSYKGLLSRTKQINQSNVLDGNNVSFFIVVFKLVFYKPASKIYLPIMTIPIVCELNAV